MDSQTLHQELLSMQRNLSHSLPEYIRAARNMIYFVKAVDLTLESLYEGPALQRAIWRYEALWLPLLAALHTRPDSTVQTEPPMYAATAFATKVDEIRAKNFTKGGLWLDTSALVPPIDIAWVWHCHRLNPTAYMSDLANFAAAGDQATVEHLHAACATTIFSAFKFSDGEDAQSKPTRRLWNIVYPYEPFMPKYLLSYTYEEEEAKQRQKITSYTNEMSRASFLTLLEYDLVEAARIQKSFLYQLVAEDWNDMELFETNAYLNRAYQRYLQFLALHNKAPDAFLVPMNDINIMWHMHLSCTAEYKHDCTMLIGHVIKHEPIGVNRSHETELEAMSSSHSDIDMLEEDEKAELIEKRRRGISIKPTKVLWESFYGSSPRYDLPDTLYRGAATGRTAGFKEMFEKINGSTKDISWQKTLLLMVVAVVIFCIGIALMCWSFVKTLLKHGKYIAGIPLGMGIMALGLHVFLAIPISRPLSSDSRYWLEKCYKQTHNPLPPFLVSSSIKKLK